MIFIKIIGKRVHNMKKLSSKSLISKDLDHLGIVAGICNEIGLIRCIDQIIPPDIRTKITIGECVQLNDNQRQWVCIKVRSQKVMAKVKCKN